MGRGGAVGAVFGGVPLLLCFGRQLHRRRPPGVVAGGVGGVRGAGVRAGAPRRGGGEEGVRVDEAHRVLLLLRLSLGGGGGGGLPGGDPGGAR
eukprot:8257115-Pyramimonas_sp.AAC.1